MRLAPRHLFLIFLFSFTLGIVVASFAGFRTFIPGLLRGAVVTVQLTLLGCGLALVLAFIAGFGKMSSIAPVRWLAVTYIEVFRGTSALVQLFWIFFVLPEFGIFLEPLEAGVLALGMNVGAYGAEVVRGAVQAVPRGQYEACTALNMGHWAMMRRIILPQAVVAMIPPWGNLFIELMKATALVSAITLTDLTFAAYQLNQTAVRTIEIFGIAMVIYYGLSQVIRYSMLALENRLARGLGRGRA